MICPPPQHSGNPIQNQTAINRVMGGGVVEIANAVGRSHGGVGMTKGWNRSWQVERNRSVTLVGTVRI